ncbi:putative Mg2+ transporter-C (MgtC) family protein [Aneurinibacillus soli]|uniref:Putative Mg(2+) transport ATPase n=1 Tax=Aneurinibacillus soli TaxID=1500254 RepID=A0A0U4WLQ9_9BACL|nr:MgtC/SapB family protein [Aneurinibacillus soli]PYE59660.1 putative Mg2+ transporter-C (MgtC) family protein [Aneurinibacillus soli]BAU29339.1 putative Mg(2+) transport ATPase [Aneurinibacillus soli]
MTWEMILKLCLALLFGLCIGIDRQIKQKPLGLKPSMVICIASCLITIISIEAFSKFAGPTHPNMDPMRLAAQIISGVGFIGGGVILRRKNDVISGLTSASLIWASSGLGIAVGAGFYVEAICAVTLLIIAVNVVPSLIKFIGPNKLSRRDVHVKIVVEPNYRMTELIKTIERKNHVEDSKQEDHKIRHMRLKDVENGCQLIELIISAPENQYTTEIYYYIKKIDYVLTVEVEHL